MLTEHASLKNVKETLLSREQFHPFPKYEEREAWETLPPAIREFYQKEEETILSFEIPALLATAYMNFYRTDTIPGYQPKPSSGYNSGIRRSILWMATMAECIEGKGKYIDKIIDLVWAICEESSWIDSHHNNHMHNHMLSGVLKNALPDVTDYNFVDLNAGTTASVLTWVYYFLKDRLDEESPLICKRIELELYKRIVWPFMHHDDMTWFGFYGHKINNWNPWILENIMPLAMIVMKDPDLQVEYIARCMEKLDIYVEDCNSDGGCDEGPGYWNAAGGTLFDCLEELHLFTDGKLNFFDHPVIKNIGEYIVKAHLCGKAFANFADCPPNTGVNSILLYRFGARIQSARVKAFASNLLPETILPDNNTSFVFRLLRDIFEAEELAKVSRQELILQDDWLPDTQLFYVRDKENKLVVAAKGGFNNESHNHNDLGHFICTYEGTPFIVDVGPPLYTAKAFSPFRYEIWQVQSAWHNCATLNGFDQHNGDEYRAQVLDCTLGAEKSTLSLELKGAYEKEAGIESYVRTLSLDKVHSVWTVIDDVKMAEPSEIESHFITVREPKPGDGFVEIPVDDTHVAILAYDKETMVCTVDTHDGLDEERRVKMWGFRWGSPVAYRIHLTAKEKTTQCISKVTVTVMEK